jgi:hypothetical protein
MAGGRTSSRRGIQGLVLAIVLVGGLAAPAPSGAIPCLSGFVRGPDGAPVANADLDFNNSITGERLVTPGDNTDADGFYSVCVLPGVYDVAWAPPPGTRLLGHRRLAVDLTTEPGLELEVVFAEGLVVTGQVWDLDGNPVPGVDIDVDRIEGGRLYTPGDNTDATGAYRIVVPEGTHRFRFEPPRGSRLRGAEVDSVEVALDRSLYLVLEPGILLAGRVTDPSGTGAGDVDIEFRDARTGAKVFLANNATNAAGDYVVAAEAGFYDLRYLPSRKSDLVALAVRNFEFAADTDRNQVLVPGKRVEVVVTGTGGLAIRGADLDVKDAMTGEKLFTPHDRTDELGVAVAILPDGVYDFIVDPPPGASYAGGRLDGVAVGGNMVLDVRLEGSPRVTVTGRVVDASGSGVAGAVFGARLAGTGEEIDLPDGRTGAEGSFALDVPPLPLDLTLAPPPGTRLVGRRFDVLTATADTSLGDIDLETGFLVTIDVVGPFERPVAGADVDFVSSAGGGEIYLPRDDTDAEGRVVVVVPPGPYRLEVTPPPRSGFLPAAVSGLSVSGDTLVRVILPVEGAAGGAAFRSARPNPFRETVTLEFTLVRPADVAMVIYDLRGRRVAGFARTRNAEGAHAVTWDGTGSDGRRLPAGVYFVVLSSNVGEDRLPITLVR